MEAIPTGEHTPMAPAATAMATGEDVTIAHGHGARIGSADTQRKGLHP